jgi:hypothetical protein
MMTEFYFLLPLTFVAAMLNATVGGGGLVLIPGMFTLFPSAMPATIIATEKCASVAGQATASVQYARRIKLPWKLLAMVSGTAFFGAHLGARAIAILPATLVKPFIVVLLIVMLIYTWFKPEFGKQDAGIPIGRGDLVRGLLIGSAIGFYEGFFGPGAGSFLIFLFIRVFHFDFLRATACAKLVNASTNVGALAYFIPAGLVSYSMALPMAVAMIGGSYAGSHLAMKGGNQWIRRVFLILVISLLAKLIADLISG